MRFFLILLIGSLLALPLRAQTQEKRVNLNMKDVTVKTLFDEIQRQTDLHFIFNTEQTNSLGKLTVEAKNEKVDAVLKRIFEGTDLICQFRGNVIVVKSKLEVANERKAFHLIGKVTDKKYLPLPGVTVKLVGTMLGTATNMNGIFSLQLPMDSGRLELSFIGFKKKTIPFNKHVSDTLRVVLEEDVAALDEVVVRAYGTQSKREVISAISTVTAEEMKELPTASITGMLQGRLAGVNVIQQSGAPGSAPVVSVRGFNSLLVDGASDGQPLWVVDGVPMHSFVSPVTGTNTLADLDPSMIESVQVLKDAAAASIYGSRAGNGVILITTKKGRAGEAKFSANVSYTIAQVMEYPLQTGGRMERWLDISQMRNKRSTFTKDWKSGIATYPVSYEQVWNTNGKYDTFWGNGSLYDAKFKPGLQDSLDPYYNNVQNWWKYLLSSGYVVNANLQASGGSDRFQYMVGVGYYDEKGIMINSGYSRANLQSNLSAKLTKDLRMDTRIYLSYADRSMNRSKYSSGNSRYEGMEVDATQQPTYVGASKELQDEWLKNIKQTTDKTDDYRAMASVFLEYNVLKGLTLSASGNVDYSQGNMNKFKPSTLDSYQHENISSGGINRVLSISTEELLNYHTRIGEAHNLDILLGMNINKDQNYSIGGYGKGGASDYVYYYDPAKNPPTADRGYKTESLTSYSSDFTEKVMVSYFGRLGYNYKQRYLVEFTFRRDGSSTFGEGNRWANFPSVALGWTFSEESFIKRYTGKWLNMGKLRGSYGTSGQIFNKAYMAYGLMSVIPDNLFHGNAIVEASQPVSPSLTWEKTEQYDLGLDMDMFNYRVNLKLDYYYKYTSSLIYDVPLPANIYNFNNRKENAMDVSNEGIEMELLVDVFRDGPFSWRTKLNVSKNWNRFEKSYSGKDLGAMIIGRPLYGRYAYADHGYYESEEEVPHYYTLEGYETFLGKRTLENGVSGYVGTRKVYDANGDGKITMDDMYIADSPLPKVYGGWVNELRWRNFDLNMLINYSLGRKIVNNRVSSLGDEGPKLVDYRDLRYWTGPGCNANLPMLGTNMDADYASNIENVHSMSLKQLTIGYNLPEKIARKARFSGVRFFATGENLFYLSNYSGADPEVVDVYLGKDDGKSYPLPRKWTLGLTLSF